MFKLTSTDQAALTSLASELVRTPSPPGHEKMVADLLAEALRRVGFPEVRIDRIGNVVAHAGAGGGPALLFNGHMDTVGVGDRNAWRRDPYSGEVEAGVLYGRGAVDMKGPLASLVYGMKMALESPAALAGDLYVACVVQEEPCEGYAMKVLVEEEKVTPDMVIVCEPTNLQVATGHRGRVEMLVTVRGAAAHAASPAQGDNAIYTAARIIFGTELLASQLTTDAGLGRGTLAVTQIESAAGSRNAIPDYCAFYIDRRLTLGETEARALAEIQAIINREHARGAKVEVTEYRASSYTGYKCRAKSYYPAWLINDEHPLARSAALAVEQQLGYRPHLMRWGFSTDGCYTAGVAGIPTVGFGPGDERLAHAANEAVPLDDLYQAAGVYAALATQLL